MANREEERRKEKEEGKWGRSRRMAVGCGWVLYRLTVGESSEREQSRAIYSC